MSDSGSDSDDDDDYDDDSCGAFRPDMDNTSTAQCRQLTPRNMLEAFNTSSRNML